MLKKLKTFGSFILFNILFIIFYIMNNITKINNINFVYLFFQTFVCLFVCFRYRLPFSDLRQIQNFSVVCLPHFSPASAYVLLLNPGIENPLKSAPKYSF